MKDLKMVLCFVLLFLLYTNTSNAQDTPEFLIDTSIVFGHSYDHKGYPAIAFDGTNYLVVWEEENNGNINIIGTFVDQSGKVLTPHPDEIIIANGSHNHLTPDIAFDGNNYLVVWCEEKINPENRDIIGTRISPEGEILDPAGINISAAPEDQFLPSITFGGAYYFISWCDLRDTTIKGTRVNTSGEVQDSLGIIISSRLSDYWNYRGNSYVISDGTNYLACWYKKKLGGSNGNFATLINQNGEVLDTIEILTYSGMGFLNPEVSLAFDGDNYFFVGNIGFSTNVKVVGIRINTLGTVIDTIIISYGATSSVSYNNGYYLVGFTPHIHDENPNIYAKRVDKSGVILDSTAIQITHYASAPFSAGNHSIASDGTNSLIIWDTRGFIEGSRVDENGNVLDYDGIMISTHPQSQINPSVASDGSNYFITWKDTRYNIFDIYGTRIDQQGNNLNPNGVYIRKIIKDEENNPKVTFGGSYYMAVWIGYEPTRNICGARIDQSGILMDTSSVVIFNYGLEHNPSIASDGDKYLITSEVSSDIYGLILNQSGTLLYTFPIPITEQSQRNPSIAYNGSNYLVVWQNYFYPYNDIYGTLVDTTGLVLQPDGIEICIDEGDQVYPSAASDGNNYFVVWQDNLDSPTNIYGARLDSTGTLLDTMAIPISLAEGDQKYPAVAFNGNEYVVVWQDNRNSYGYDIYGARVSTSGNVIDSFVVSNAFGDQLSPDIAYSSDNQVLVVYSGWTGEYEGKLYDCMRIWGRYLGSVSGIDNQSNELVTEYKLAQCYPNPFNSATTIQYSIKERSSVELVLYDILGRQVKVLIKENQDAGNYKVNFDAGYLASGIYLYRLNAGNYVETKKMVLMK